MKKGNPAAALAIIASIFGAAGVIGLLPDAQQEELLVVAHMLPARPSLNFAEITLPVSAQPAMVERASLRVAARPIVRRAVPEIPISTPVVVALQFSGDAGSAPALVATHLSFVSAAAAPIDAEPVAADERARGPVPAALDRTGSALAFAFRKTGAGVKTAFSVFTP